MLWVLFPFFMSIAVFVVTNSLSSAIFSALIYAVLILCAMVMFNKTKGNGYLLKGLSLVYIVFIFLGLCHYGELVLKYLSDEADEIRYFIPFAESCIKDRFSLRLLYKDSLYYNHGQGFGYLFYIGLIANLGEHILGGYNVFMLILSSVLLGGLYTIFLSKILVLYFEPKIAMKYSLIFMLCTPITLSSVSVLRDGFIALLYLIGIYIVLKNKKTIVGLCSLLLIMFLISTMRLEHALFFALFVVYYLYLKFNKYKLLWGIFGVIFIVFGVTTLSGTLMMMGETFNTYTEYTMEHANASGLAMVLLSLPSPIKEVACTIFSQMFPIPPWISLSAGINGFPDFFISSQKCIRTVVWFAIVFNTVRWVFTKSLRNIYSPTFNILLLIALVLIIACSSEYYESRRMMCVYPILFLVFVTIKERMANKTYISSMRDFATCYSLILMTYLLIA